MILIFGLRRLRKSLGPILLRCSNCGASPLGLFRVSTWFAVFFIPLIPVSFKQFTVCPNCKRLDQVSKQQVENARVQEGAMKAANPDATAGGPAQATTLEGAVNEWAPERQTQSVSSEPNLSQSGLPANPHTITPPQPQPPAGWYPDPAGSDGLRYWDGRQWTEHTSPSP